MIPTAAGCVTGLNKLIQRSNGLERIQSTKFYTCVQLTNMSPRLPILLTHTVPVATKICRALLFIHLIHPLPFLPPFLQGCHVTWHGIWATFESLALSFVSMGPRRVRRGVMLVRLTSPVRHSQSMHIGMQIHITSYNLFTATIIYIYLHNNIELGSKNMLNVREQIKSHIDE